MRRREATDQPDVRARLADRLRQRAEHYSRLPGADPGGYRAKADRLDAGEPVAVYGWQLPDLEVGPGSRVQVEPDGSITDLDGGTCARCSASRGGPSSPRAFDGERCCHLCTHGPTP